MTTPKCAWLLASTGRTGWEQEKLVPGWVTPGTMGRRATAGGEFPNVAPKHTSPKRGPFPFPLVSPHVPPQPLSGPRPLAFWALAFLL